MGTFANSEDPVKMQHKAILVSDSMFIHCSIFCHLLKRKIGAQIGECLGPDIQIRI